MPPPNVVENPFQLGRDSDGGARQRLKAAQRRPMERLLGLDALRQIYAASAAATKLTF
ncbi:MAG TPA: hypothetical protein VHM90_06425 [Phycisphaerae bacterium]|nr:hypothetical protein [Phycisphaerae bacterium]